MSELKILKVPAIFHVGAPTKDRGMRFRGETQELTDDDKLTMLQFDNAFGYLTFSTEPLADIDLPKDLPLEAGRKTQSQRLRAVLAVQWQQSGRTDLTVDEYYYRAMERIINDEKSKLD